jgi:hypothetical protein
VEGALAGCGRGQRRGLATSYLLAAKPGCTHESS